VVRIVVACNLVLITYSLIKIPERDRELATIEDAMRIACRLETIRKSADSKTPQC